MAQVHSASQSQSSQNSQNSQQRPLSLQIITPPSASPFPSPSSSFIPPPMPGAHEFAVKPPPRRKSAVSASLSPEDNNAVAPSAPVLVSEPTVPDQINEHRDDALLSPTPMLAPISTTSLNEQPPEESTPSRRQSHTTIASPTILNSPSLASSRPAPLSPAPSRRVSTISARSSKSGIISTPLSRSNSKRESRGSGIGLSKGLTALSSTTTSTTTTAAAARKDVDAVFDDEPLITPTVSALSMNLQSPPTTSSSSSSSSTSSTTAIPVPTPSTSSTTTPTTTVATPSQLNPPSTASSSTTAAPAPSISHPPSTTTNRRPTSTKIKIRDFAYTSTDNRYRGLGSDVPKPNQFSRLNKKLGGSKKARPTSERWSLCSEEEKKRGTNKLKKKEDKKKSKSKKKKKKKSARGKVGINGWDVSDDEEEEEDDQNGSDVDDDDDEEGSSSSSTDDEEEDEMEEEEEEEGWFKKGMGRFSWSFGFSGFRKHVNHEHDTPTTNTVKNDALTYPSRGEMDMNFGNAAVTNAGAGDETPSSESSEMYYDAHEEGEERPVDPAEEAQEEGGEGEGEEEEGPLYPGLYRALYPFEPEGTAEMRLEEDQVVKVVGRGGGVGWAVVVVPEGVDGGVVVGEQEEGGTRHALVPEGYLELVELD